ncbi:hypothetical protein Scep_015322 [Stephania cephalantha]|uniref:Uncharacterized protein n=1 Tax=Stephania cephalantha TaxID=152367 RepID=A0AAP0P3T9_9MAGN
MVRRSEFDAVVQRLAQLEAFVQSQLGMRMDFGSEHLSCTTTATTSRASPAGWDRSGSFTTAATRR